MAGPSALLWPGAGLLAEVGRQVAPASFLKGAPLEEGALVSSFTWQSHRSPGRQERARPSQRGNASPWKPLSELLSNNTFGDDRNVPWSALSNMVAAGHVWLVSP